LAKAIDLGLQRIRRHHLGHGLHGGARLRELEDDAGAALGEGTGDVDAGPARHAGDQHALAGKLGVGRHRQGAFDHAHQHWGESSSTQLRRPGVRWSSASPADSANKL